MERIDLTNYEAFFLDFVEGNLSAEQEQQLNAFLDIHPELKSELEEFESIQLEEEQLPTANLKHNLLREESTGLPQVDYLMISEVEGTITPVEKAELASIIKGSPALLTELSAYHTAKLKSEEDPVHFPHKDDLIRKERKLIVWWKYVSAAAAVVLVAFLLSWNINQALYAPRSLALNVEETEEEAVKYAFIVEKAEQQVEEEKDHKLPIEQVIGQFAEHAEKPIAKQSEENQDKSESFGLELAKQELIQEEKEENEKPVSEENTPVKLLALEGDELAKNKKATKDERFIPIDEFAREKIKKNVLKGKTFSETVIEELAELSNDKIRIETEKDQDGKRQSFALNIGKFSFSRNK